MDVCGRIASSAETGREPVNLYQSAPPASRRSDPAMLRLLQISDVHIGARHLALGQHAPDQRARQLAAFDRAIDLALATPVDALVVAGDLFDGPVAPRATVERVATSLRRLVDGGIRILILPGEHDAEGRASLYYAQEFAALASSSSDGDAIAILTQERPDVRIAALGARFTRRFPAADLPDDGWRVGLVHLEQRPRDDEIAGAGVDYLAIGGPHSADAGTAGTVTWGASGSPELVDVDLDQAGNVLIVTLDEDGPRPVIDRHAVGSTRFERLDVAVDSLPDQASLIELIVAKADPDLILDVDVNGTWPDDLEFDAAAVESALEDRFLAIRVRVSAVPALTAPPLPPADTILGAFIRDLEGRIVDLESQNERAPAAELREALRLGRRLLVARDRDR